jgi:biotin transport system substrate-specific component
MEAILKSEIISGRTASRVFGVSVFVILTCLGAFVRIPLPFTPVPITLQTFFVLLGGALLGSYLGSVAQLGYILLGVSGAPVFTGAGSGLSYLLGPTAGYILGFILAAFCLGRLVRYGGDSLFLTFIVFLIADMIILSSGVLWLKFLFKGTFVKLMSMGFVPFIPGDSLKALAAAWLYLKLKNRVRQAL